MIKRSRKTQIVFYKCDSNKNNCYKTIYIFFSKQDKTEHLNLVENDMFDIKNTLFQIKWN